jgi:hypothetical protein
MIYFIGWVVFMVGIILAVPIAAMIDRRKMAPKPKPQPIAIEEPIAPVAPAPVAQITETELEKRLRRLRLISEGMSQEEMFAHAQATLELASILEEKGRLEEANQALDILVNQPGIGDYYLLRSLLKHVVLLQRLKNNPQSLKETMQDLRETVANVAQTDPDLLSSLPDELTPQEIAVLRSVT